ncbi:hypothetical protein [Vibrio phage vB_VmeM-Yong XC32]|nr:hypothetical protein [Vibrio phage vB_VmeM-Yong XC31]QAX96348.1 hypothetical protein [Vibrio phage vB_VmeM-Yong XC32]QAX96666.1 hypothetical protein [Vibrio phage vB_VmeM-Yong MS31]QAX96984.1 hypothetical protein [Vibrio phage vB_VmeM-Yong MS32]
MYHKRHKLSTPLALMRFFAEVEALNAKRETEGKEPFQPLLEQQSLIVCPHVLLGMYDVIRQNLALKPQVRYLDMLSIMDLVLAAAVGKENAFITESVLILPYEQRGSDYAQLTDLEIGAAAQEAVNARARMRIAEAFDGITPDDIKDFMKENDIFRYEEAIAMGLQVMGRPNFENPIEAARPPQQQLGE